MAHRAGDRTAEAEGTAGRPEVAAAVALAREEAAQAPVVTGPAEDLGVTIPHVEDVVAKDEEGWEGGRRKATRQAATVTDQATGMTTTSSHLVEAADHRPRQTHFCRSWKG